MPTYVYKFVKTGETIEVQQSFSDPALTTAVHPRSGRKMAVKKVFTPVGVTFRGDGFYKTDSRSKSTTDTKPKTEATSGESSSATSTDGSKDAASTKPKKESPTKESRAAKASAATAAP